jgi:hypothetical protein
MKYNASVYLNLPDSVFHALVKYNAYTAWLEANDIKFETMLVDRTSACPNVLLMTSEDAVVFKLRFGL